MTALIGGLILITAGCNLPGQISTTVPTQTTLSPFPLETPLVSSPAVSPQPSKLTPTPVSLPTGASSPPAIRLDAPLSLGLVEGVDLDFLAKHLRSSDYVAVRLNNIDALDGISGTNRSLVLTAQDVSNMSEVITLARDKGITMIGYNLEGQLSKSELVAGEIGVYDQVKAAGIPFMFGPTVTNLLSYYNDFAKNANAIMIQSQRMQGKDNYADTVKQLIANIKTVNPDIHVWVQISVVPPNDPSISTETVLNEIASIADSVDGLFLFFPTGRWDKAQEIIVALRP